MRQSSAILVTAIPGISVKAEPKQYTGAGMTRLVMSIAAAQGNVQDAAKFAAEELNDQSVSMAINTAAASGGVLIPQNLHSEVIELLRDRTIVRKLGARSIPLPNGNMALPRLAGGATASYTGEGKDAKTSEARFDDVKLTAKTMIAMVPISNQLIGRAGYNVEQLVLQDILTAISVREDKAFMRDDGTGDTPVGMKARATEWNRLLPWEAAAEVNLQTIDTYLDNIILMAMDGNSNMISCGWGMSNRTYMKLFGLRDGNGNKVYQSEFNRLIRQETEQTLLSTQAKSQLNAANKQLSVSARAASAAVGMARGALALVGGPVGAAMLAGSALLYFHNQAKDARQSAIDLKDAVVETTAALMKLSEKQLAVKQLDLTDQLNDQLDERGKLQNYLNYVNKQIEQSNKQGWIGDFLGNKKDMQEARQRTEAALESMDQGINKTRDNLENVGKASFLVQTGIADYASQLASDIKTITTSTTSESGQDTPSTPWTGQDGDSGKGQKAKVNQYDQLRREIEAAHASSLGRINLQEQESTRKLLEAARADGASEADIQKTLLLNAENYQKQRLELAEQYAPARATLTKERDASQELKSLLDARLLDEKEYQTARITLAQSTARELLQAQAAAMSAPLIDIAGTVDPLAELRNQLAERQSLLQAFYQNDAINKEQYELLKQKADTRTPPLSG